MNLKYVWSAAAHINKQNIVKVRNGKIHKDVKDIRGENIMQMCKFQKQHLTHFHSGRYCYWYSSGKNTK